MATVEPELKKLKEEAQSKKVIVGTDLVLKGLRAGRIGKVFLARNCPAKTKEDVLYYAGLAKIPVVHLEQNNEEIGVLCKKNFFVSVVAIRGA